MKPDMLYDCDTKGKKWALKIWNANNIAMLSKDDLVFIASYFEHLYNELKEKTK